MFTQLQLTETGFALEQFVSIKNITTPCLGSVSQIKPVGF